MMHEPVPRQALFRVHFSRGSLFRRSPLRPDIAKMAELEISRFATTPIVEPNGQSLAQGSHRELVIRGSQTLRLTSTSVRQAADVV
jgi:hypothetical protein